MMIQNNQDLQYFDDKVDGLYQFLKDRLEIEINGASFFINHPETIKDALMQIATIGYERHKNNSIKNLRQANKHKMEPVLQFSLSGKYLDWFPSLRNAADSIGVDKSSISTAIKRAKKGIKGNGPANFAKSCGFLWCYEKDFK